MSESYSFFDIRVGEPPEATDESRLRRAIADELKTLNDRLIRLDAPMEELEQARAALAGVNDRLSRHESRDYPQIMQRLFTGQGNRQDVLDIMDYEILTGRATAVSPPLELWLDGDTVRGRANFGPTYQGPPGRVHGGVISLALDMLMAKCQDFFTGIGFTGTLNIRYLAATPLETDIDFEARVASVSGRKLFTEAKVFAGGAQTVEASGIWISGHGEYQLRESCRNLFENTEGVA